MLVGSHDTQARAYTPIMVSLFDLDAPLDMVTGALTNLTLESSPPQDPTLFSAQL